MIKYLNCVRTPRRDPKPYRIAIDTKTISFVSDEYKAKEDIYILNCNCGMFNVVGTEYPTLESLIQYLEI